MSTPPLPVKSQADDEEKLLSIEEPQPQQTSSSILPPWALHASESAGKRAVDAFWVALNTVSTIGLVFINKHVFSDPQLHKAQILVNCWHFLVTFLVLLLAAQRPWQAYPPIRLPSLKILPLSGFFAASVTLSNLSLALNTVGFFQLTKVLTTPCVVFLNFLLFRESVSYHRLLAVLFCCVGTALASSTSWLTNPIGVGVALAAIVATACYQIWIKKKQDELEVSSPQLLLNQSAFGVLLLIPASLALDTLPNFYAIPLPTLYFFLASGLCASLLNLSQFLIIGRTSALTFNIVSNIKMVSIISLGWYTEGKIFTWQDVVGVHLALFGVWYYTMQPKRG